MSEKMEYTDKYKLILATEALEKIATMVEPDDCAQEAEEAGLDEEEYIHMAYENALWIAQSTIKNIKNN